MNPYRLYYDYNTDRSNFQDFSCLDDALRRGYELVSRKAQLVITKQNNIVAVSNNFQFVCTEDF